MTQKEKKKIMFDIVRSSNSFSEIKIKMTLNGFRFHNDKTLIRSIHGFVGNFYFNQFLKNTDAYDFYFSKKDEVINWFYDTWTGKAVYNQFESYIIKYWLLGHPEFRM